MRVGRARIREIVNEMLRDKPTLRAGELAAQVKISRQAAHRHLARLVREEILLRQGEGRGTCYRAANPPESVRRYRRKGLAEESVWGEMRGRLAALADGPSENVESILQYAVTEIVNNSIDHSGGEWVDVRLRATGSSVAFEVIDDGVGIFEHLRARMGLPDKLSALQELSKGKLTTLPERHSGEGIFFVSKIADFFEIESDDLAWRADNRRGDASVGNIPSRNGTRVRFEVDLSKRRTLPELFSEYTEEFEFVKTRIVVKLFESGERFISRSEAKRVLHGLERFKEVTLDFRGVTEIGQGFADETFRVWPSAHPEIRMVPVNMCPAVEFMVKRALPKGG